MRCVHFRDQERNVGIHAVIAGIADDWIAGAGEFLFGWACDAGIERGEDEIAVESRLEALHDEITRCLRDGRVEMPARGFRVRFSPLSVRKRRRQ